MATTTKRDPRLSSAQVPKFTAEKASELAKRLDFAPKYVYAAAVSVLGQLDTKQQIDFIREAHQQYAEADTESGSENGNGSAPSAQAALDAGVEQPAPEPEQPTPQPGQVPNPVTASSPTPQPPQPAQ